MIIFEGWRVPNGFSSDGCTFAPDTLFGVNLKPACVLHDFARRHLVHYRALTVSEADALFRRHLKALGAPSWLATLYWFAVKITRPWFQKTQPIPTSTWLPYLRKEAGA